MCDARARKDIIPLWYCQQLSVYPSNALPEGFNSIGMDFFWCDYSNWHILAFGVFTRMNSMRSIRLGDSTPSKGNTVRAFILTNHCDGDRFGFHHVSLICITLLSTNQAAAFADWTFLLCGNSTHVCLLWESSLSGIRSAFDRNDEEKIRFEFLFVWAVTTSKKYRFNSLEWLSWDHKLQQVSVARIYRRLLQQ